MPRSPSQSISLGTSSAAAGTPGLEKIPTFLMPGIEEEFFVPFRSKNWALDNISFVIHPAHGHFDPIASRRMQLGVADDSTLSNLVPPDLKLGFDEYNHFRVRL